MGFIKLYKKLTLRVAIYIVKMIETYIQSTKKLI